MNEFALYDLRILSCNVFQPYLSFNNMQNEISVLMVLISYIAIILNNIVSDGKVTILVECEIKINGR
jgi:hypothetical protein